MGALIPRFVAFLWALTDFIPALATFKNRDRSSSVRVLFGGGSEFGEEVRGSVSMFESRFGKSFNRQSEGPWLCSHGFIINYPCVVIQKLSCSFDRESGPKCHDNADVVGPEPEPEADNEEDMGDDEGDDDGHNEHEDEGDDEHEDKGDDDGHDEDEDEVEDEDEDEDEDTDSEDDAEEKEAAAAAWAELSAAEKAFDKSAETLKAAQKAALRAGLKVRSAVAKKEDADGKVVAAKTVKAAAKKRAVEKAAAAEKAAAEAQAAADLRRQKRRF
ncbi:hypothetical protein Dimus_028459 [Dionaea muscipula]